MATIKKERSTTSGTKPTKRRSCACMQNFYRLCDVDPKFRERNASIERSTLRRIASVRISARRAVRVIPVVVHVVYRKRSEKISMAQIRSQIKVLNQDFRAKNTDKSKVPDVWCGLVGDTRIEFELAKSDPRCKKTNGVTYTKTDVKSFSTDDTVKSKQSGGIGAWSTTKYLNIWVCTLNGGVLGYAQFPGGPRKTDGVVILNTAFGTQGTAQAPFNEGRTAVHEIGHFLNLRHIWGDVNGCGGTDFVADTPDAEMPNMGKPVFPSISCSNGPHGDMFMNYMDYVDDIAMIMFTVGQVARMEAILAGPRKSLGHAKRKVRRKKSRKKAA